MKKECVICGTEFEAVDKLGRPSTRRKTCSEECKKKHLGNMQREKDKRLYWRNPEKYRAKTRRYHKKKRECLEWRKKRAGIDRNYYKKNREKILDRVKKYRQENPETIRERKADYYYRTIDKQRARDARRNAEYTAASALVRDLSEYGLVALESDFSRPELPLEKQKELERRRTYDRKRKRKHDPEKARKSTAKSHRKRAAALRLVRELKEKGLEALL